MEIYLKLFIEYVGVSSYMHIFIMILLCRQCQQEMSVKRIDIATFDTMRLAKEQKQA